MGQRFQLVVKTPPTFINENNPNNNQGDIFIYHFQWLWGDYAIWRLGNFINGLKELIEDEKNSDWGWISFDRIIEQSLNWVMHKDLKSQNRFHTIDKKGYFDKKPRDEELDLEMLFNEFDNNNGILYIEITEEYKIKYFFYNPHDNEENIYCTPLDYKNFLKRHLLSKEHKHFVNEEDYKKAVKAFDDSEFIPKIPKLNYEQIDFYK